MQLGVIDFSEKHANIGTLFWATVTYPRPQTIRSTETKTLPMPSPTKTPFPIKAYVNTLKTQGKNETEILQVLQMCYEEPKEEISVVSTQDF